jgi:hypothetical protein
MADVKAKSEVLDLNSGASRNYPANSASVSQTPPFATHHSLLRWIYPAAAFLAVLTSGAVHGLITDRWQTSAESALRAERLELLPYQLGDWVGQEIETDAKLVGPVAGFLHRRYLNRQTGNGVTVFMVCGRPGPVCIHTPDVCYAASGYEILSQEKLALPPDVGEGDFWTAKLRKTNSTEDYRLRIFWSWSDGREWSVPEIPRLTFARRPVLFKLYLIREQTDKQESLSQDPCLDLLRLFQPQWQRVVFTDE